MYNAISSGHCNLVLVILVDADRPVVLLQHGLLSCSVDWVLNPVNESFAFLLADAGFDVWLGNSRGNTYALRHETLTPDDEKFWDFRLVRYYGNEARNSVLVLLGITRLTFGTPIYACLYPTAQVFCYVLPGYSRSPERCIRCSN